MRWWRRDTVGQPDHGVSPGHAAAVELYRTPNAPSICVVRSVAAISEICVVAARMVSSSTSVRIAASINSRTAAPRVRTGRRGGGSVVG